jgi:hypothetical protein
MSHFIPVKVHIKEQREVFKRFRAQWTPTQLVLDADGTERHRIEGFLPVEDFIAQLEVGLGRLAFELERYDEAAQYFRDVCDRHASSGAAPEACYWAGVSVYKSDHRQESLHETERVLRERYPDSEWARKASVWAV